MEVHHEIELQESRFGWYIRITCSDVALGDFGISGWAFGSEKHARRKAQRIFRRHAQRHTYRKVQVDP